MAPRCCGPRRTGLARGVGRGTIVDAQIVTRSPQFLRRRGKHGDFRRRAALRSSPLLGSATKVTIRLGDGCVAFDSEPRRALCEAVLGGDVESAEAFAVLPVHGEAEPAEALEQNADGGVIAHGSAIHERGVTCEESGEERG